MPARGAVRQLPALLRAELDKKLIDSGFGGYAALSDWLAERGHEISKSTLHRYGGQLERRIEQLLKSQSAATALVEATEDRKAGDMADAAMRLAQRQMFELMLAADAGDMGEVAKAARALAETARAGVVVRAERRKILKAAADAAEELSKRKGFTAETIAEFRRAIEGD